MLEGYLKKLPSVFKPYRPFPHGADRVGWFCLEPEIRASLVTAGEACLGYEYPALRAADWLAFTRTGNRTDYEAKYFDRRLALCALVLAECAEYRGRFLDDIINGIFAVCEESGWHLPAHNTYVRDAAALPLPDAAAPLLDLFACETGALLAAVLYLLGDKLDGISGLIRKRIVYELERRVLRPYLDGWFWWMGGKGEKTNNWTAWCAQNVLLTLFLALFTEPDRLAVVRKAAGSLDAFLDGYGEDGCCDEGAQYYRHAALCLFGALDVLDNVTDGLFARVWREDKMRNMAHYILDVHVYDKYYVNFADCSPVAGRAGVREYLYGKRCGDKALCDFAASDWRRDGDKLLSGEINLFYRARALFAGPELTAYPAPDVVEHREVYYPSAGLFIARDDTWCLAVKAGDNGDSHNHNDTGSFTLYKNGLPFLIDIGVGTYTARTFSPGRYGIWTMQSSWHNLPDFGGATQRDGEEFSASDVEVAFGRDESSISMELSGAWPESAGLKSLRRRVSLHKGSRVVIEDTCEGSFGEAALNLIFCQKPELGEGVLSLPGLGDIALSGAESMERETVPITDARLRAAWPEEIYRVRARFRGSIRLVIT